MKLMPKVYASVLNWNNYETTIACLESVSNLSYPNLEIIVVDNASTNDSVNQIKRVFPNLKIIQNKENLGYAGGHRVALDNISQRKTGLFWILNNDVVVRDSSIYELINAYQRLGNNHIYGGIALRYDNPALIDLDGFYPLDAKNHRSSYVKLKNEPIANVLQSLQLTKVSYLHGSSLLIPLEIIQKHGFMDESFFLYGEEVDYCSRLLKLGIIPILVPTSNLTHIHSDSLKGSQLKYIRLYYHNRGTYRFVRKTEGYKAMLTLLQRNFTLSMLLTLFFASYYRKKEPEQYYTCLGILHALIGRMGRTLNPADFL